MLRFRAEETAPDELDAAVAVDIWRVPLDQPRQLIDALWRSLTDEERRTFSRLRCQTDRDRRVVARVALRRILANLLSDHTTIRFATGAQGKPHLPSETGYEFSLSRSEALCLIAIARGCALGIDIERIVAHDNLSSEAAGALSPAEVESLRNVGDPLRTFYLLWTAKEAYLKAIGVGLAGHLKRIAVSIEPSKFVALDEDDPKAWSLLRLEPAVGYVGALAVRSRSMSATVRTWPPTQQLTRQEASLQWTA